MIAPACLSASSTSQSPANSVRNRWNSLGRIALSRQWMSARRHASAAFDAVSTVAQLGSADSWLGALSSARLGIGSGLGRGCGSSQVPREERIPHDKHRLQRHLTETKIPLSIRWTFPGRLGKAHYSYISAQANGTISYIKGKLPLPLAAQHHIQGERS